MTNDRPKEAFQPQDETSGPDSQLVCEALMAELVKLRKKRKIGQQPVAEAIGISQSSVSQMENLKTGASLEAVMLYARAIGANIVVIPAGDGRKKQS